MRVTDDVFIHLRHLWCHVLLEEILDYFYAHLTENVFSGNFVDDIRNAHSCFEKMERSTSTKHGIPYDFNGFIYFGHLQIALDTFRAGNPTIAESFYEEAHMALKVDLFLHQSRRHWKTISVYARGRISTDKEIIQEEDEKKLETSQSTDDDGKNLASSSQNKRQLEYLNTRAVLLTRSTQAHNQPPGLPWTENYRETKNLREMIRTPIWSRNYSKKDQCAHRTDFKRINHELGMEDLYNTICTWIIDPASVRDILSIGEYPNELWVRWFLLLEDER